MADSNRDGQPNLAWQDPVSGFAQIWCLGGPRGVQVLAPANLTKISTQDPANGAAQVFFITGAGAPFSGYAVINTGNPWFFAAPHYKDTSPKNRIA